MKNIWKNHLFLWRLCFRTAPGFMIYFLFDAFRYQFIIFLEHTLGIQYVCTVRSTMNRFGKPFS